MDSKNESLINEENEDDKKTENTKKLWIIAFISILMISLIIILVIIFFNKNKEEEEPIEKYIKFNYEIITSETGPQNILVNWTAISNITLNIIINVKGVMDEIIRTYNISNTIEGEQLIKVYFGTPKLNIILIINNKKYEINEIFNIPAKEIVFITFHATLPILMFSFDIFNIIKSYNCPIYVLLERYNHWNWNNIPDRISTFDILNENFTINFDYEKTLDKLKIWIGQIYQINNKTIFNFYINDFHNYIIPLCIFSNNIPSEYYKIYLLSDGSASYMDFNEKYDNNETYTKNYEQLKNKYKAFKEYIWERKRYERYSKIYKNIDRGELRYYVYTIIKEENNTFWWLTKIKGLFAPNNPQVLEELLNTSNIYLKDLNYLFKSLNASEKEQIKNLFNFSSNIFEEAYKQNKSVMLIAGTNDNVERNLIDYCVTTQLFYKDDYIYYYKAHPQTPIENNKKKIDNLKKINMTYIDTNFPFEVIMYFNPNVSCSGYYTSSFIEIDKKNLKSLFEQSKSDDEYHNKFDYFCQYIKKDNKKYGKYLNNSEDGTVLEINKNKLIDFEYDFGIYLKRNKTIDYYKYE